jgi:FMN phosphatase YigB (HAD superfamily)
MAFKSLLLDIDGVLIRDKLLLEHVKENCAEYVRSKLPESKNPRETNRLLYISHGHTARGLTSAFGIDTSDFNAKVYDKSLMDHLAEVIYTSEFQQEAKDIHELVRSDWNVNLFTNAPIEWAAPIARAIGDEVFISCAASDVSKSPIKPEAGAYTQFAKHHTHIYVDDSLKNIGTARWLPNWHPVYFNEGPTEERLWCPQVGSVWELCMYVNSVDRWIGDNHNV